jgi:hypothetical protein
VGRAHRASQTPYRNGGTDNPSSGDDDDSGNKVAQLRSSLTTISCSRPRIGLASASCTPTSSAERQAPRARVANWVVAMLPSSRRQLTVMVNSNFASSSIAQPNIAWPRPSTGPQVFTGLDLSTVRQPCRFSYFCWNLTFMDRAKPGKVSGHPRTPQARIAKLCVQTCG